jgi:predicted metal-dependent peptidase
MTEEEAAVQEQRVRNQVASAAMVARLQGKMPADLERAIGELLDPQVPWYTVLRDYMQRTTQEDESWSRRNRRMSSVYLPAKHSEKMGEITVIIDTSGSIREEEITQAMSEVTAIAEQVEPERIRIVWADARVAGEQIFEAGDTLTPEPAGGGGTDMRIPLTHIEQYAPHIAILITDGYTPWPTTEPPYPLIVCCTTDIKVPIGAVIRMRGT